MVLIWQSFPYSKASKNTIKDEEFSRCDITAMPERWASFVNICCHNKVACSSTTSCAPNNITSHLCIP